MEINLEKIGEDYLRGINVVRTFFYFPLAKVFSSMPEKETFSLCYRQVARMREERVEATKQFFKDLTSRFSQETATD
ncbi:hypothetical protein KA107_01155 [Candidatus Pacearchaeota archaeon]|nr:hypothetical protein [Candidatus Pacearchaeota archaeon]